MLPWKQVIMLESCSEDPDVKGTETFKIELSTTDTSVAARIPM